MALPTAPISRYLQTDDATSCVAAGRYLAYQAVHGPTQVPQLYRDRYEGIIKSEKRITFGGMLSAADDGIGNVSAALAERGMDSNLVTVITTDNGGPNDQGPNTTCPP